jgi:poly(A) polymerase
MSPATPKIDLNDPILLRIAALAADRGVDAYVVGGYVRDALMGRERTDVDITIVGDAQRFADAVATIFRSTAIHYERFRTSMVPIGDHKIEFVGTRSEVYTPDSRDPIVSEGTLEDDLRRRDFTVNAMAASLQPATLGTIVDLFDGAGDLALRVPITVRDRAVGDRGDHVDGRPHRHYLAGADHGRIPEDPTDAKAQHWAGRPV